MTDFHLTTDTLNLKRRAKTYRDVRLGSGFMFGVVVLLAAAIFKAGDSDITWTWFILLAAMALFLSLSVYAHIQYGRANRMIAAHRCTQCGYDLTGNTTGHCPECGHVIAQTPAESS